MQSISNLIQKTNKKTFGTVAAAGLLALVIAVSVVSADGPVFNIFPISYDGSLNTDFPLLDARNVTKGENWSTSQSDHDSGVTADPGDVVEFLVYYHNGAPDDPANTANNVMVNANVPSSASNLFTIGASISASNAATISSQNHGGDMAVRVNGPITQTLSLVTGSTIWMPDRGATQQTMPNTITSTGVNLGSIRGCWQFSGFVKFQVKISASQPNYSLSIVKEVRKLTDVSYSKQVNANPGDTVEFRLTVTNTGTAPISSVMISDTLPSQLTYLAGTLASSQPPLSGNLFSGGMNVGSVSNGSVVTVKFQTQVAGDSSFPVGTTTLENTGTAWGQAGSTSVPQVQDKARVVVTKSAPQVCTVSVRATFNGAAFTGFMNFLVNGPTGISGNSVPTDFSNSIPGTYTPQYVSGGPTGANFTGVTPTSGNCPSGGSVTFTFAFTKVNVYSLSINKQVRNVTTGSGFSDVIAAQPSQVVEYMIVIQNNGNTDVTSATARDVLPTGGLLTYNTNSLTVDGAVPSCPSCFFSGSISLGTLAVNETRTIVFSATIAGQNSFAVGTTPLTNTAYTKGTSVTEISDTARVDVTKQAPQKENGNPAPRP